MTLREAMQALVDAVGHERAHQIIDALMDHAVATILADGERMRLERQRSEKDRS